MDGDGKFIPLDGAPVSNQTALMSQSMYTQGGFGKKTDDGRIRTLSQLKERRRLETHISAEEEMNKGYRKLDVRLNKLLAANNKVHGFDDPIRPDVGKNTIKSVQNKQRSATRLKNGLTEFPDCDMPSHASKITGHPQKSVSNLIGLGYTKIPKIISSSNLLAKRKEDLLEENKNSVKDTLNNGNYKDGYERLNERETARTVYDNNLKAAKLE